MFQTWCPASCAAVSPPTTTRPSTTTRRTPGPWSGSSPVRRWWTGARWASVTRTAGTASVTTSGATWTASSPSSDSQTSSGDPDRSADWAPLTEMSSPRLSWVIFTQKCDCDTLTVASPPHYLYFPSPSPPPQPTPTPSQRERSLVDII